MTGNLILNANPSVALGAATKQYVDSAISGAGSGSSISTTGGYSVHTGANDLQFKKNNSTYQKDTVSFGFLGTEYSTAINRRNYAMTDSSSVNYVHAGYLVQQGAPRPLI